MQNLLKLIKQDYPSLSFEVGQVFCWSPNKQVISYVTSSDDSQDIDSLLHEVSHALLGHSNFNSDLELLQLEVAAWQLASELASRYNCKLDEDHVQDCLDSYRNWLHRRSSCPNCQSVSLQEDKNHYKCFNCDSIWRVSNARFCRPYRQSVKKQ